MSSGALHRAITKVVERRIASLPAPLMSPNQPRSDRAEAPRALVVDDNEINQFAVVELRIEPMVKGGGFEFEDGTKGGSISRNFIPAVEAGVKEAMENGVILGSRAERVALKLRVGYELQYEFPQPTPLILPIWRRRIISSSAPRFRSPATVMVSAIGAAGFSRPRAMCACRLTLS